MVTSFEALALFILLLPGLLGLLVYETVSESFDGSTFDKVLAALVLTIVANLAANKFWGVDLFPDLAGATDTDVANKIKGYLSNVSFIPTIIASIMAFVWAIVQNKGWDYSLLRLIRASYRVGRHSPWHDVFSREREIWLRIRFKDGVRLVGWPKYYSEGSEHKELFLTEAEWHVPKSAANKINKDEEWESKCVQGPGVLLTEFDNVVAIDVIRTEKN